jgi:hypothetical protein
MDTGQPRKGWTQMTDREALNRLIKLRIALEQAFGEPHILASTEKILTEQEKLAWLKTEPSFTRRIVTRLGAKRPPDKLPVYL